MGKKLIVAMLTTTLFSAMWFPALVHAEPLAHLETNAGIIDVVGFEVDSTSTTLFIINEYQNTTNETCMPGLQFNVIAFQDGVQLNPSATTYLPEGCNYSSTQIKPDTKLKYASSYTLTSTSPVELEVSPVINLNNEKAECTIDLTADASAQEKDAEPDYKAMYNELKEKYDQLLAEVEKLKSDKMDN